MGTKKAVLALNGQKIIAGRNWAGIEQMGLISTSSHPTLLLKQGGFVTPLKAMLDGSGKGHQIIAVLFLVSLQGPASPFLEAFEGHVELANKRQSGNRGSFFFLCGQTANFASQ